MDRICGAVLNKIHALSPAGRYVIIAEDEFLEAFPQGYERSFEALKRSLTSLCKEGYIDVKYSRGEIYCVAPLKKYVDETPQEEEEIYEERSRSILDPVLISAFAGGALGSLIISLIFAFV